MIVHEVCGERIDEENLLAGLRMCSYHGMFGVGKAFLQLVPLFDRHPSAKGRLDTVPGTQILDLLLDPRRQILVGECHVHPNRVAADRRCFHTTQYTSHGRVNAPGGVAVICILEMLRRAVQILVDADQARVVGVAAQSRMILEFTESLGKFYVLGFGEGLVAKEQNLVFEQQCLDFGEECIISRDLAEIHPGQLCPDRTGQFLDADRIPRRGKVFCERCGVGHDNSSGKCCFGSDGEDGGTDTATGLHVVVRTHRIFEGVPLVDLDLDSPGLDV